MGRDLMMGRLHRARSNPRGPSAAAQEQARRTAQTEAAAARAAADKAAADKAAAVQAAARVKRDHWLRGFVMCAQAWLLLVAIATIVAPPAPTWLRVVGIVGGLFALTQLGLELSSRRTPGPRRARSRHPRGSGPEVSLLAARNPELSARVKDALRLLDGPVGQLVDADVVASTRTAFTAGVDRVDQLYQQEIDLRADQATLGDDLHAAGHRAGDDEQYQAQRADLARLQAQREQADNDLSAAATTLITSVTEAAFGKHRRAAGAQLSVQRRRALSSDSAPDLVLARGSGALSELTDAVDGVRARLDAVHELDDMTDRFAPDAAEAEVEK